MKTELEIFRQKTDELQSDQGFEPMTDDEFEDLDEDGIVSKVIIPCMQEFADQFRQQWVSVKERLPEEAGRYWCNVRTIGELGVSNYQWNCSWCERHGFMEAMKPVQVTHWTNLLPTPPSHE